MMAMMSDTSQVSQAAQVAQPRILILCTHNSARSQMGEALIRHAAQQKKFDLDVHSAGTEATFVKDGAKTVMAELDLDLSVHHSKTLHDVPDAQNFDYVITVCDSAHEACPVYPNKTVRRHYPFTDPSGGSLERWRQVRDQMRAHFEQVVTDLSHGHALPASYDRAPRVDTE